jgi:acetolactate synthase-1/2/3 large subunit
MCSIRREPCRSTTNLDSEHRDARRRGLPRLSKTLIVENNGGGRRGSDLLVSCLEAEDVRRVFGIPGEETVEINESLARSSVEFVAVRHEQGAALIADVLGRLTGRPGVCLGTLGPGATNLVTGVADALLDHAPLVALTGQGEQERLHKESHQHIDTVEMMRPITKWSTRVPSTAVIPEVVRKAFKVATNEQPGPVHVELPADVMAAPAPLGLGPLPITPRPQPEVSSRELADAAQLLASASRPVVLAGSGVVRQHAAAALRELVAHTGLRVAETLMGKGIIDARDDHSLGAVGLQARDYALAGFDRADLVLAVGYDLVEHAPEYWNTDQDKRIIAVSATPVEVDQSFVPDVELVGDVASTLRRLAQKCGRIGGESGSTELRDHVMRHLDEARRDVSFPMRPGRIIAELRDLLEPHDVLVSDVGLHKLLIGRMYPAYEPNSVLIANGLATMGFAVPAAIAAKLVHPERTVIAVSGDGGFLMNVQELETACRLGTAFVNVVWENGQFGSIAWKQDRRFGRHFGTDFGNPDFVRLGEAFGMPSFRVEAAGEFSTVVRRAMSLELPSLVSVPVDYGIDIELSVLGEETTAT